ncbi:uncharacterized protein LA080_002103 [Diaporthe eres]|nr:uncharacterized protein LA080_002103 [Diaporthe eres]
MFDSVLTERAVLVQATIEDGPSGLISQLSTASRIRPEMTLRGIVLLNTLSDDGLHPGPELTYMHEAGVRCVRVHGSHGGSGNDLDWAYYQLLQAARLYPVKELGWAVSAQFSLRTWSGLADRLLASERRGGGGGGGDDDLATVKILADHNACAASADIGTPELAAVVNLFTNSTRFFIRLGAFYRREPLDIRRMRPVVELFFSAAADRLLPIEERTFSIIAISAISAQLVTEGHAASLSGTSIWDVVQLCVRMCIEQGLHKPPGRQLPLLEEQLQRRVFCECYMIDRYSSSTLDRPFAISDQDIATPLPAHVDDADLAAASALYPDLAKFETRYTGPSPNEMTVFLANRRSPDELQLLSTGNVFCALDDLLGALEDWRTSTPMVTSPKCLYERHEYFEFLYAREKLLLIRRVMEVIPKRKGVPPQNLLALSLRTAARGIELFSGLFEENAITYTRSYFSFLFTAGLSIMLSVSVSDGSTNDCNYTGSTSKTLAACEDTLRRLGEKLPDAKPYVTVFEALHRNVAKGFYQKSNGGLRSTTFTTTGATGASHKVMEPVFGPRHSQSQAGQTSHADQQGPPLDIHPEGQARAAIGIPLPGASWPQFGGIDPESAAMYRTEPGLEPASILSADTTSPDEYTMFPWASLTEDNPLGSMEAGLGECAYGDAGFNMALFQ